mgnify:CR=1 FL=1
MAQIITTDGHVNGDKCVLRFAQIGLSNVMMRGDMCATHFTSQIGLMGGIVEMIHDNDNTHSSGVMPFDTSSTDMEPVDYFFQGQKIDEIIISMYG